MLILKISLDFLKGSLIVTD